MVNIKEIDNFWEFLPKKTKVKKPYKKYGRCINLSIGLVIGACIDKYLLLKTCGGSVLIPPFAGLLCNKGFTLKKVRFEEKEINLKCLNYKNNDRLNYIMRMIYKVLNHYSVKKQNRINIFTRIKNKYL